MQGYFTYSHEISLIHFSGGSLLTYQRQVPIKKITQYHFVEHHSWGHSERVLLNYCQNAYLQLNITHVS